MSKEIVDLEEVNMRFKMAFGEIEIYHNKKCDMYTAKWGEEEMPFVSKSLEAMIQMVLSAQWASQTTYKNTFHNCNF